MKFWKNKLFPRIKGKMSAMISVGIDVGSQKAMIVKEDADIIRTDTGMMFSIDNFRWQNDYTSHACQAPHTVQHLLHSMARSVYVEKRHFRKYPATTK